MMDSSFLIWIGVGLSIYSGISFFKLMTQFGLPNHPVKWISYLLCLCVTFYLGLNAMMSLGVLEPIFFLKWRTLPLVAAGLALLLQTITLVGNFSLIQQKIVSRIPLIGALLVFAFFPPYADQFFILCLIAATVFLSISVGKARYQKRQYFKMILFFAISMTFSRVDQLWAQVIGESILFVSLFYFYVFEQTFGVAAMIESYQNSQEGVEG